MNDTAPEISLALPAYNEEQNIARVLDASVAALEKVGRTFEIIVIDNHSSDGTSKVVRDYSAKEPRVRLIVHEQNRLYSGSCATALREARGRYVAIMDSDGQFSAGDVPRFLEKLEGGASLVMGWRKERHDPPGRLLTSLVFNTLGKVWLGYPLHDLNCGIRMFDRRFVEVAEIKHRINMSNPELFVCARRARLPVDEVVVTHAERHGGVTSHDFKRLWRIFLDVNKYFRTLRSAMGEPTARG